MPTIKSVLWRLIYAVLFVVIVVFCIPLLFALLGLEIPVGPAITLLKFAFGCLICLFIFFGPDPPAPF